VNVIIDLIAYSQHLTVFWIGGGGWRMLGLYNYKGVVFKITLYEGGGVNKSTFLRYIIHGRPPTNIINNIVNSVLLMAQSLQVLRDVAMATNFGIKIVIIGFV